jgi:D-alanyl-D-alanine dipeptidase
MRGLLTIGCVLVAMMSRDSCAQTNDLLAQSTQLIVVTAPDWNSVQGRMERWERIEATNSWRAVGEAIPIVVGKSGMAWGSGMALPDSIRQPGDPVKHEGDGRSPAGVFSLGTAFGYASSPLEGTMLPYLTLTETTECVDDVQSNSYNRLVDRSAVTPDWKSSEHMRDVGEAYRLGIVVNHNGIANPATASQPVRGGGSCIFLHIWKDAAHGTAGCTAMSASNVEGLLRWLDPKRHPMLVQVPTQAYARLLEQHMKLPGLGLSTPP